jgi:hypothetical protein
MSPIGWELTLNKRKWRKLLPMQAFSLSFLAAFM